VRDAAAGDSGLRREVESLLAEDHTRSLNLRSVMTDAGMSRAKAFDEHPADVFLGVAVQSSTWAYLFTARIACAVSRRHLSFPHALGRLMGHEPGHLILPATGHSACGLMRASLALDPRRYTRITSVLGRRSSTR
jgi:hypothetical protein